MATEPCFAVDAPIPPNNSTPNPPAAQPLYKTIWQADDKGTILHLQSGLSCDLVVGTFHRTDVRAYKLTGLDVSCNYVDAQQSLITLYLTRRESGSLTDAIAEAEREMIQGYPDATPIATPAQTANGTAQRAFYARSGKQIREGIWIDDLAGWTLEYRATWAPQDEAAVLAELTALTTQAQQSAGAHLARCAKSAVPARDGVLLGGDTTPMALAFTTSAMVEALPDADSKFKPDPSTQPVEWCVEGSIANSGQQVLLWHGINAAGMTVAADRASLVTPDEPLMVESQADPQFNLIQTELKRTDTPIYTATWANGDDIKVLGFFTHRPDTTALAGLISDIANHHAHIVGGYNAKTKNITITTPGTH